MLKRWAFAIFLGCISHAVFASTTVSFYAQDQHGSMMGTTDSNGSLATASLSQYNDYGVSQSNASNNNGQIRISYDPYQYSGQYTDNESGLQPLGNGYRYYAPNLMRFISPDSYPLLNLYAYSSGNPIMNMDPTGHMSQSEKNAWEQVGIMVGLTAASVIGGYIFDFFSGAAVIEEVEEAPEYASSITVQQPLEKYSAVAIDPGPEDDTKSLASSPVPNLKDEDFDSEGFEGAVQNTMQEVQDKIKNSSTGLRSGYEIKPTDVRSRTYRCSLQDLRWKKFPWYMDASFDEDLPPEEIVKRFRTLRSNYDGLTCHGQSLYAAALMRIQGYDGAIYALFDAKGGDTLDHVIALSGDTILDPWAGVSGTIEELKDFYPKGFQMKMIRTL